MLAYLEDLEVGAAEHAQDGICHILERISSGGEKA